MNQKKWSGRANFTPVRSLLLWLDVGRRENLSGFEIPSVMYNWSKTTWVHLRQTGRTRFSARAVVRRSMKKVFFINVSCRGRQTTSSRHTEKHTHSSAKVAQRVSQTGQDSADYWGWGRVEWGRYVTTRRWSTFILTGGMKRLSFISLFLRELSFFIRIRSKHCLRGLFKYIFNFIEKRVKDLPSFLRSW